MNGTTLTMEQLGEVQQLKFTHITYTRARGQVDPLSDHSYYATGQLQTVVRDMFDARQLVISPQDVARTRVFPDLARDDLERWVYQVVPAGRALAFVDAPDKPHAVHPNAPLPPNVIIAVPKGISQTALAAMSIIDWDSSVVETVMCTPVGYDFAARQWMFDVEYSRTHGGLVGS